MANITEKINWDIDELKAYAGYFYNTDKLLESSSGGMATAISEGIIRKGGVVFGVTYSADFKNAEYCCVTRIDDLYKLKGSKYITSQKKVCIDNTYVSVYQEVKKRLEANELVLFIGLGCDVGALYRFCELNGLRTDNLYTMDLICHGPTYSRVAEQFIERLEKKYRSQIVDFTVRYKKDGWTPPYLRASFKSGAVYEQPFYETDYGKAFAIYTASGCFNCKFKGAGHIADLTVGDCWGIDSQHEFYNRNGVSVALVRKDKGNDLLNLIDDTDFCVGEIDVLTVLKGNPRYYLCKDKSPQYDAFENNFHKKGLHYAAIHLMSVKARIKSSIKYVLKPIIDKLRHN